MADRTVLLVDDEEGFVDTVTKRLSRRKFRVMKAYSGREAVDVLASNQRIDAVVLDAVMPQMDGIDTLIEIKRRFPHLEVIILTGRPTTETAIEGMKRGAFDYLTKPCDVDELILRLEEAIERTRAASLRAARSRSTPSRAPKSRTGR